VSIGWLEPLLSEIATNRRAVVCPIIDVLSDETFEYITGKYSTSTHSRAYQGCKFKLAVIIISIVADPDPGF
jgi:hypothetical protein